MVPTQPENSIVLTSDEQARMEISRQKLANVENEVTLAMKHLTAINKDILAKTAESKYQDELLKKVSDSIVEKQKESDSLDVQILAKHDEISVLYNRSEQIAGVHDDKENELIERERVLNISEKSHAVDKDIHAQSVEKLEKDKQSVETAKSILSEALTKIYWN